MSPLGNSNLHPKQSEELGLSSVVECMPACSVSTHTHGHVHVCTHTHTDHQPVVLFTL